MVFTQAETRYLIGSDLGRIATTGASGQPHVTPVTYEFDPGSNTLIVPGFDPDSKKGRDLRANRKIGFVVDDVVSLEPFEARGVVIHGVAELHEDGGEWHPDGIGGAWLRIVPNRTVSWGLNNGVEAGESRGRETA